MGGERTIKVADGANGKIPEECKSTEYVVKMHKAMAAWVECNEKDRSYIMLSTSECNDGNDNSRSGTYSMKASQQKLAQMLRLAITTNKDFRDALEIVLKNLATEESQGK